MSAAVPGRRLLRGVGLLALAGAMSACQSNDFRIEAVEPSPACDAAAPPGARLLDEASPLSPETAPGLEPPPASGRTPPSAFDHEGFWLLRVDMGCQPSGGYGLRLLSDRLELAGEKARLALAWEKPDPDRMQIQMITCPCRYLRIPKGEYRRLEIVDQEGKVRHELVLP